MDSPYQAPMSPKHVQASGGGQLMSPLIECAGWLQFLGWLNIILGILYCMTIVLIVIGWVPIWLGVCLKNAGEAFKRARATGDPDDVYRGNKNLSTAIKIVGVIAIIYLALFCLYLLALVVFFVIGLAAGVANG